MLEEQHNQDSHRANLFRDAFDSLKVDFGQTLYLLSVWFGFILNGSNSLSDISESVEKAHDVLDDLWRQCDVEPYPQKRMWCVLSVIEKHVLECIKSRLGKINLMRDDMDNVIPMDIKWKTFLF